MFYAKQVCVNRILRKAAVYKLWLALCYFPLCELPSDVFSNVILGNTIPPVAQDYSSKKSFLKSDSLRATAKINF